MFLSITLTSVLTITARKLLPRFRHELVVTYHIDDILTVLTYV